MRTRHKAAVALAFVILEISFWSIFLKIGGSSIGIIPQLFYGFLVGLVVSLLVALGLGKGKELIAIIKNRNTLFLILIVGLLNNALTQLFLGIGTLGTNPSIGSIVYRSYVIFVALLIPIVLRQKVKKVQLLATLIGFFGIYIVLTGGTLSTFNVSTISYVGILLLAAASTGFAVFFMSKYNFDQFSTVVLFNLASLVFISVIALATHTNLSVTLTPASTISILFLGVFAYGIGTSMIYYSFKVLGPLVVGNAITIVPFLTIILSALITNTPIAPYYLIAALFVSGGVLLQRHFSTLPERITKSRALNNLWIFDITSAFADNRSQALRNRITGSNRAFAIKLDNSKFDVNIHSQIFLKNNCIAFTNVNPYEGVQVEEINFINNIMKLEKGNIALIGIGEPKNLETSFGEFVTLPNSPDFKKFIG